MASIRENKKNGKTISYRFIVCMGRDEFGKQIRYYTTWKPPIGLSPAKEYKAALNAAALWENGLKTNGFEKEKNPEKPKCVRLTDYIENIWFPLEIANGEAFSSNLVFYSLRKICSDAF